MSFDLPALITMVAAQREVVRIVITRSHGSTPREAGTSMLVWATGQDGTIGGGALEYVAVQEARAMLADKRKRQSRMLPLGPALGQCCGGAVSLFWEHFHQASLPTQTPVIRRIDGAGDMPAQIASFRQAPPDRLTERDGWLIEPETAPRHALWIWGAGHVGRALVSVLAPLPDLAITWVDTAVERFPETVPPNVTTLPAAVPPQLVRHASRDAHHLVLTYAHELDLALCHALLTHDFTSAGLIGSATKWARFRTRLATLGHTPAQISRIACPIGDPRLGKHPQAIALGVSTALLHNMMADATESVSSSKGAGRLAIGE